MMLSEPQSKHINKPPSKKMGGKLDTRKNFDGKKLTPQICAVIVVARCIYFVDFFIFWVDFLFCNYIRCICTVQCAVFLFSLLFHSIFLSITFYDLYVIH